jgi:hypothetical protein
MKKIYLIGWSIFLLIPPSWAQGSAESCGKLSKYLFWTGEEDNDFFIEGNWRIVNRIPSTPTVPSQSKNNEPENAKPACLPGSNKLPHQICFNEVDLEKDKVNHLLGFNESDNCNDQSGQFNNLCKSEVAVGYYENIMKTGMSLGTTAPRENGPTG